MEIIRDVMEYDVVIIGAGPSGLATAIKLKQLANQATQDLSICILEKGSEVGAHIISGCVMNPLGLDELLPNWQTILNLSSLNQVTNDATYFLSKKKSYKIPTPKDWQNHGNYIISLSQLCRKLAEYAESLGIEIYPGFSATQAIIEDNLVKGVITGDVGINQDGSQGNNFQPGIEIRTKHTIIAEGCRGSIAKQIINHFNLDKNSQPQTYGLGIKEIWRIPANLHQLGKVIHTIGYPLNNNAYGGGFIYHMKDNLIAIGLVTALNYTNPYLSPFDEFQKLKHHPTIAPLLENGQRIEYGARTVSEGGIQSLPQLEFAGGLIVGDSAGFLNVPKIKGVHNSIKSGILAAQAIITTIKQKKTVTNYEKLFKESWLYNDLYKVRNIRPAFNKGLLFGLAYTAFEKFLLRGHAPWTLKITNLDYQATLHKSLVKPIEYPSPDHKITFDRNSSVHLANVTHNHEQPIHLKLINSNAAIAVSYKHYASPESRFCPAGVYEIIKKDNKDVLLINAQNCVHCKACDIKTPNQNINWTTPEGGSGPQYSEM